MKKIVLFSFVIFYLVSVLNAFTAEKNNSNNIYNENNNNNNIICPKLPPELWKEIVENLIYSNTIPELEKNMIFICQLIKSSKFHFQLVSELLRKKLNLGTDQLVTINDFYNQRKNEIINEIKNKLEINLPCYSYNWFNDINSNHGRIALMYAVSNGLKEISEILIQNKADVNYQDEEGLTPLMMAAIYGFKEIVELLVQNGAAIDEIDEHGKTAIQYATEKGHKDIVTLLESQNEKNSFI